MKAASISAGTSAIRQMLARAIAILAVAMLVAHAAAAKGVVSHDHDHALAHAGASLVPGDPQAEPAGGPAHSPALVHAHDASGDDAPPCCGEACLTALLPGEDPLPDRDRSGPSRSVMPVPLLTGRDPEGVRRPPRCGRA